MNIQKTAGLVALVFTVSTTSYAVDIQDSDLVTFQPNTPASSSEVNQNITVLKNGVNSKQDKVGAKTNANPMNHDRYSAAEAQAGMGGISNANPLNHSRYSDGEAVTAVTTAGGIFFGGDGSAGDLTINILTDWRSSPPASVNFNNITIASGQRLVVPAGTTIRCSGNFINNGTIFVDYGAGGQSTRSLQGGGGPSQGQMGSAHPGDAFWPAAAGRYHDDMIANPTTVSGGGGGVGIPRATTISSFNQFRIGGGSGGGSGVGGLGGGLLKVYCQGAITNTGVISAMGRFGNSATGGGGGGIVVLASMTAVDNSAGGILVRGGSGGGSSINGGSSGGGGGGIVVLVAPVVATAGGSISVAGGISPTATGSIRSGYTDAYAGGGGGASGGNGGRGGDVSNTRVNQSGTSGAPGYTVILRGNPASMVH